MRQQQIQPKAQLGKIILVQLFRIVGAELVGGRDAADHCEFVRVHQGPGAGVGGVAGIAVEGPDKGDDECVVRP